jgi:hypothetical protein
MDAIEFYHLSLGNHPYERTPNHALPQTPLVLFAQSASLSAGVESQLSLTTTDSNGSPAGTRVPMLNDRSSVRYCRSAVLIQYGGHGRD